MTICYYFICVKGKFKCLLRNCPGSHLLEVPMVIDKNGVSKGKIKLKICNKIY